MDEIVVGVDEVGRGCLAGPVVCAAVVLPETIHSFDVLEIRDSKKLSAKKRQILSEGITEECIYSIREGSASMVDSENILQATLRTMWSCVHSIQAQLGRSPDLVLVDGPHKIPKLDVPQEAIKGGDNIHKAIGAASIIAKVYRDEMMVGWSKTYPEYGFEQHKGYGTEQHREAIMVHGPCPLHRLTFKGVTEYVKSKGSV